VSQARHIVSVPRPKRIRGIQTLYGGIQFRSRHEAAWAALFDELKIGWDYEPTDLNGYIPDFDLKFRKRPLLVEIKPLEEDFEAAKLKISFSEWPGDIAVLVSAGAAVVGELYEEGIGWDRALLAWCLACKSPTIVSESGRWACRNCDASNREIWFGWSAERQWAAAKNLVQWRAKK
jgi:hypothetical protein